MKKQKIGDLTANEIRDVDRKELKVKLESYLANVMHTTFERATAEELYKGLATVVNGQLADQRMEFNRKRIHNHRRKDTSKKIYYICMEFLLGQSLKNHLYNLGETEMVEEILQERDNGAAILLISLELDEIMELADTIGIIYRGELLKTAPAGEMTSHEVGRYMMGVKDA